MLGLTYLIRLVISFHIISVFVQHCLISCANSFNHKIRHIHVKHTCHKDSLLMFSTDTKNKCLNTDNDYSGTEMQTTTTSLALVPYDESSLPIFHRENREFTFGDKAVKIKQNWQAAGVAAVVWDAAVVLCEYLYNHGEIVHEKKVIELGAGTGITGIIASYLGAVVTITDRGLALKNINNNVQLNQKAVDNSDKTLNTIQVKELSWGENLQEFKDITYDVILGAEIIYIEETFPLLLQTLDILSSCETKILLSCKIRYERDQKFLDMMKTRFNLSELFYDKSRDIHLYLAVKLT